MPSQLRVFDFGHKCAVARLFVGEKGARWINRRGGQAQRLEFIEKFLHCEIKRARLDQPVDDLAQGEPVLHVFQFWIEQLRRPAEPVNKTFPMIGLIDEDARIAVAALIGFRHRGRLAVPGALRHFAADAVTRHDTEKRIGGQHILQRYIDIP